MNQQLTINDFKLFEKQIVNFRNLTVLAGINSVGKSTIIQSLLILRATFEERRKYEIDTQRFGIALNGPYKLELGNTHEVIRRGKRLSESTMTLALCDTAGDQAITVNYSGDRSTLTNYQLMTESFRFDGPTIGLLHPHFYYLCAERIGPRLKYEYDILPFPHAGYQGQNTFQLLSGENVPIAAEKAFNPEDFGLMLSEVRIWLDHIIPGASFENADAVGRSRVIEGTFGESLPTNVGFGISYVLPIIVNGLLAEPDTYYVVENPEAHLHPLGQSRIGKFLAQVAGAGVNVVIETHSEHVINGIRLASLTGKVRPEDVIVNYVAKPDTETKVISEIDLTLLGDLTAYPKGFFDQEQTDIAAIIREKRKKL